jgi:hypothetical protein
MPRESLPNRRVTVTREIQWPPDRGMTMIQVSIGFYEDGRPSEVFVTGCKSGTDVQAVARDASIILSLALQHGVPIATIRKTITRDHGDRAASLIGAVVDMIAEEAEAVATAFGPKVPA